MKKMLVALAVAAFATAAQAAVSGSTHDMSSGLNTGSGALNGTMSSCDYCHAVHLWVKPSDTTMLDISPLWNRNVPAAASITAYNRTGGATGSVTGITRACLSCHDGATAFNAVLNGTGTGATGTLGGGVATYAGNLQLDLRDDHPVGMVYPPLANAAEYQALPAGFVLVAGNVECTTCHSVHNAAGGFPNFLVAARTGFCGNCHIK